MQHTLTIHAGLPKCGSTALQFILASNKARLAGAGAFYPDNEEDGIGHMPLCNDIVQATKVKQVSPMLRRMVEAFGASGAQKLVLSSEGFAIRSNKFGEAAFGDLLKDFAVEVVLFVRRRDEWVRSFYKQSVKSVGRVYDDTLYNFCFNAPNFARRLESGHVAATTERFASLVGADGVKVISLDAERKGTPELFGRILGIPLEEFAGDAGVLNGRKAIQFERGQPINLAFSDLDTMFLAATNGLNFKKKVIHEMRIALSEADTSDIAPNVRLLDPELAQRLLAEGAEDDRAMREKFGAALPAFAPKAEDGADYRQKLTRDEFEAIRGRILDKLEGGKVRTAVKAMEPGAKMLA